MSGDAPMIERQGVGEVLKRTLKREGTPVGNEKFNYEK
jgi:hypothetical protein